MLPVDLSWSRREEELPLSVTLAGQNYEFLQLRFDGNNFRVVNATPQTINTLGGLISPGTPASSTTTCNVGQLQADINYLYSVQHRIPGSAPR